eukprot:TRINITY_DN87868_c0_g1_i1.p6 TRINITY_DN87868_c0_g1~~TRINITY_DN87868_c0_g1_i1.p6  ORF type:complete len:175 (-),score=18.59 TRINITY_DN87868_c0_g1_i1:600-1124(-)
MDKVKESIKGLQPSFVSCRKFSKKLGRRKKATISAVATVCTGQKVAQKVIKDKGKVETRKSEVVDLIDGTKSFAGQVFNNIQFWRGSKENSSLRKIDNLQEIQQSQELDVCKYRSVQENQLPSNILKYLQPASMHEIKHVRVMAQLSALSYNFGRLTSEKVRRLVNMELVTISI